MAENLDIRTRLTAEDEASPQIRRLLDQIKQLQARLNKSLGNNPIVGAIADPKILANIKDHKKQIDGLTPKYMRWARSVRDSGQMSASGWQVLKKEIADTSKAFESARGKNKKVLEKQLVDQVKHAQAYKAVFNAQYRERERAEARLQDNISKLESNVGRRRLQEERSRHEELLRARRSFQRNLSRLTGNAAVISNGGGRRSLGYMELAAAGGAAALGRSSVKSATDLDRAEMNARINMDQTLSGFTAREVRERVLPKSVAMGQTPARYMQTIVEAAKAGVPEKMSEATAEMVTQLAKTFGIEVDQAMEGMGYAVAQEFGAGRLKDVQGIRSLANTSAFLASRTAAKPDQMLSFLRTGMGSGAAMGMDQAHTLAFGAMGIQAGAQGQQTARFLGSLSRDIFELDNKAKDVRRKSNRSADDRLFLSLPGKLGFGSYSNLIQQFKSDPNNALFDLIKSFGKIDNHVERSQATEAIFGSEFSRFLSNLISSPEMIDRTISLSKEAMGQKESVDFLTSSWSEFARSLEYFIDKVKSVWSVLKSELGDVLKPFIQQFSDWASEWYSAVKTGGLKERFGAILRGLTEGFLGRPGTFRDLLDQAFGRPGEGNGGSVESFFKFAKGFAEGLKSVFTAVSDTIKTIAAAFGKNTSDPEAMGKFTAQILGFVAALNLLSPVLSVFGSLIAMLSALAGILGLPAVAAAAATSAQNAGVPDYNLRRKGESMSDFRARRKAGKESSRSSSESTGNVPERSLAERLLTEPSAPKTAYERRKEREEQRKGPDPFFHPTSYTNSIEDLTHNVTKLGANVQRAAFMSYANDGFNSRYGGSGFQTAFGGNGGGVGGGGVSGRRFAGLGSPTDLLSSTPGEKLPNFGVPQSGSIIRRGNIPSFNGGAEPGSFGTGGSFSQKSPAVMQRLMNDFGLTKEQAAGIVGNLGHESAGFSLYQEKNPIGGGRGGAGWAQWTGPRREEFENWAKANGLDPKSDEANYGFLKKELTGKYSGAIDAVKGQDSVAGSMRAFENTYEKAGVKNYGSRMNYANQALGAFNNPGNAAAGVPASVAAAGVTPGLADQLGIKGGANFMKGQFGGVGENLQNITLNSGKKVTVNAAAADSFKGFLNELEGSGYKIKDLGGFSPRNKVGGGGVSQHAYGNAIDVNPDQNPYSKNFKTNLPSNISDMAAKYGLSWGGDWKSVKDTMHFEWMGKKPWLDQKAPVGPVEQAAPGVVPQQGPAELTGGVGQSPESVVNKVPQAPIPAGGGDASMSPRGNVAIHINGGSHDPESLATLVQRRVDESMNWRSHDTESEYT